MNTSPPYGSPSSSPGPSGSGYPPPTHPTEPTRPVQPGGPQGEDPRPEQRDLGLKPTQLAGGALAAVTTAVAASKFGVAGTLMGAAFGSVVSSVAAAVYQTSLTRAGHHIRTIVVAPTVGGDSADPSDPTAVPGALTGATAPVVNDTVLEPNGRPWPPQDGAVRPLTSPPQPAAGSTTRTSRRYLKPALAVGALAFVASVGVISLSEALLGHPISNSRDTGTSVGSRVRQAEGNEGDSTPSESPSATPSDSSTSSESPSASQNDSTPSDQSPAPSDSGAATPTDQPTAGQDQQSASPSAQAGQQGQSPGAGGAAAVASPS